jgi:hypothetical protein
MPKKFTIPDAGVDTVLQQTYIKVGVVNGKSYYVKDDGGPYGVYQGVVASWHSGTGTWRVYDAIETSVRMANEDVAEPWLVNPANWSGGSLTFSNVSTGEPVALQVSGTGTAADGIYQAPDFTGAFPVYYFNDFAVWNYGGEWACIGPVENVGGDPSTAWYYRSSLAGGGWSISNGPGSAPTVTRVVGGGGADTTPPVPGVPVLAADGKTITLPFTEVDSPPVLPASGGGQFSFLIDGVAEFTGLTATVSGTTATITLPYEIPSDAVNPELSYAPNSIEANRLRDSEDNEVAAFGPIAVTNNSEFTKGTITVTPTAHSFIVEPDVWGTGATYLVVGVRRVDTYEFVTFAYELLVGGSVEIFQQDFTSQDATNNYYVMFAYWKSSTEGIGDQMEDATGPWELDPLEGGGEPGEGDPFDFTITGYSSRALVTPVNVPAGAASGILELRRDEAGAGSAPVLTIGRISTHLDDAFFVHEADVSLEDTAREYLFRFRLFNTEGAQIAAITKSHTFTGTACDQGPDPGEIDCELEVVWVLPAADAEVSRRVTCQVELTDPNEADQGECAGLSPLPCANDGPGLTIAVNGQELTLTPTLISGTPRNGVWEFEIESRDFANGAATLSATATGVGCCEVDAEREVTIANPANAEGDYIVVKKTDAPPSGLVWGKAGLLLQNDPLDANPRRRHWMRWAISPTLPVDFSSSGVTASAKATAFDALKQVVPTRREVSETPEATQYSAYEDVPNPGAAVYWVLQFSRAERIYAWPAEGDAVVEIRPDTTSGRFWVFTRALDDSAAHLSLFNPSLTSPWVQEYALAPDAPDAVSAFLKDGKIYTVRGTTGEALALDTEPAQEGEAEEPLDVAPRRELRQAIWMGEVEGNPLGVFVGVPGEGGLADDDKPTRGYRLTFASTKRLWELDDYATMVRYEGGLLMVACDHKLYTGAGAAVPTLLHTFTDTIAALHYRTNTFGTSLVVGLDTGAVWRWDGTDWAQEVSVTDGVNPSPALAVGSWAGTATDGTEANRVLVAGTESAQLWEKNPTGSETAWSSAREITLNAVPAITRITALCEATMQAQAAVGNPGDLNYQPAIYRPGLLIGADTAGGAYLFLLALSDLSRNSGAVLTSKVRHLGMDVFSQPTE